MLADRIKEVIFIGLPGPTHNYGGLSADNVASSQHRGKTSNPAQAALQALSLVKLLFGLGIEVGILPPQLRPNLDLLRHSFSGDADLLIRQAAVENPALLEQASSGSAMWVANAATITPFTDSSDGKLHLTVANLTTNPHRRIEAADTYKTLKAIFADVPGAIVHPPLDANLRDEGAANHMRLSPNHAATGLHVFAYGTDGKEDDPLTARQTLSASQSIAATHQLTGHASLFLKQNPEAIRRGVFHNDVIAVSNESLLLVHEKAYANGYSDIEQIEQRYQLLNPGKSLVMLVCNDKSLSIDEAVHSYFFNSQIVTMADESGADAMMAIIAPTEVKTLYNGKAAKLMEQICEDASNPIEEIHYIDLHQSMNNGGGPACLRLRVPMGELQLKALSESVNVMATSELLDKLEAIIHAHYPRELHPKDIADPALYHTCQKVMSELSALMKLPLV